MQNKRILLSIQDFIYHCATGACTNSAGRAFLTYAHDPEENKYDLEIYPNHIMELGCRPFPPESTRTHVAWEPNNGLEQHKLDQSKEPLTAACTWGEGPDIILHNEDRSVDLDLTAYEAKNLAFKLLSAASQVDELEKRAQEYFATQATVYEIRSKFPSQGETS